MTSVMFAYLDQKNILSINIQLLTTSGSLDEKVFTPIEMDCYKYFNTYP